MLCSSALGQQNWSRKKGVPTNPKASGISDVLVQPHLECLGVQSGLVLAGSSSTRGTGLKLCMGTSVGALPAFSTRTEAA